MTVIDYLGVQEQRCYLGWPIGLDRAILFQNSAAIWDGL